MPPRCPSCKGKMEYKPPNYVCRECGLVIKRLEFDKMKRQHFKGRSEDEDEYSEDKRKKKDYLDWYLSSDKDEFDDE
jgi:transcription initiation factor TFIIIB Brf1 subunit/transcription initiation factor TFIIB